MQIDMVLGDWSSDGHGITEHISIECNLNVIQLEKAYDKGREKTKIDPSEEYCDSYEETCIEYNDVLNLRKTGFIYDFVNEVDKEDGVAIEEIDFLNIWMHIAKCGNDNLKWEIIKKNNSINIGGYGLFNTMNEKV